MPDLWPTDAPLNGADYADAFTVATQKALGHSPEQWVRYVLEGASLPMRMFLRVGWRLGLGFRLVRGRSVLGWPVVVESSDWIILEQRSWLFGVALLMRVADGQLTWATRVQYSSPLGRPAWFVVGVLHRRFAPRALRRAATRAPSPGL